MQAPFGDLFMPVASNVGCMFEAACNRSISSCMVHSSELYVRACMVRVAGFGTLIRYSVDLHIMFVQKPVIHAMMLVRFLTLFQYMPMLLD